MKKIISLMLCVVMLFSVFSVCASAETVVDINNAVEIESSGFEDGRITYTMYLKPNIKLSGVVFHVKFDPEVLNPVMEQTGDIVDSVPGMYVSDMAHNSSDTVAVAYVNLEEYSNGASNKPFMQFAFEVVSSDRPITSVEFYCKELKSSDSNINYSTQEPPLLFYTHTTSTMDKTNLIGVESVDNGLKIQWEPTVGAVGYWVYRAFPDGDISFEKIATLAATETYYIDENVEQFNTYVYTVRAFDGSGEEAPVLDGGISGFYNPPHDHVYGDMNITVAPGCTEEGTGYRVCELCGEESEEIIPAVGHNYHSEWYIDQDPSCTEEGERSKECEACGDILSETIPALGHTTIADEAFEPTCTEDGKTEGSHCSVCDEVFVAQEIIPATGHNESEWIIDAYATCTQKGEQHKECLTCGEVINTEITDELPHTIYWEIVENATCLEDGSRRKMCEVCNNQLEVEVIVATGHVSSDWIVDADATCAQTGARHKVCTVCEEIVENEVIEKLPHTLSDWIVDADATCAQTGARHKVCTVCEEIVETEVVEKLPHTPSDWIVDTEATCTEIGSKHKECTVCNTSIETVEILPTGHTTVTDTSIEPTCTETGLSEGSHCSVCNEVLVAQEVVPAKGHTVVKDEAKAPGCTQTGLTEGKHCSVCNEVLVAQKVVPAAGHTPSGWITGKKATVNAPGSKYKQCIDCYKKLETAKIPQLKCAAPKLKKVVNVATGIKFTWNKVSGADNYEIYRKTGKGAWKKIATVKGSVTSYTDKTAKSGTTYKYTVKAKNEAGISKYNTTGLSLKCLATPVLKAPTSSKSGITLKWNKIKGAQGYVVYRKAGSGKFVKLTTVKGATKASYVDKSANKGTTYTYKLKAYSGKTYSADSNAKTIKDKY